MHNTGATPHRHARELLRVLHAAVDDERTLDLASLDPAAVGHGLATGLGPILYRCGSAAAQHLPAPLHSELLSADLTARVIADQHLDALEDILQALGPAAAQVTLLKGVSVCQTHYPEPHLRPMGDIDLLVPRELHGATEGILRELGFRQESTYPEEFYRTLHHSMPFYHPRRSVWVEVHHSLFPPRSRLAGDRVFSAGFIGQHTLPHGFRGLSCRRLDEELHLAYACAHWAQAFDASRGLVPLLDVLFLVTRTTRRLDWEGLLGHLTGSAAINHLSLALAYLHDRGFPIAPPEILRCMAGQARSLNRVSRRILGYLVDRHHSRGQPFGRLLSESNTGIIWKTLLGPGPAWGNLARVPWRVVFPPGTGGQGGVRVQLGRITSALGLPLRTRP